MSQNNIKLTDAIAGNRTWLNRAKGEHSELCRKGHELLSKAKRLSDEMEARATMAEAMERVQRLMPADETITFLVPCD